jgi:2-oxoglutarate ferredoxin oxidoreductase subunit beta
MKYLRKERLPHIFCPGCGDGIVLNTLFNAIEMSNVDFDNISMVSGIGCSSRIPGYVKCDSLHTTHGRALAFATGLKTANPKQDVIVVTGDGDATSIGGNHLIHAARRNIDLTVICINNDIYGMT